MAGPLDSIELAEGCAKRCSPACRRDGTVSPDMRIADSVFVRGRRTGMGRQRLSAGETRVQVVPVLDLGLAQSPAEEHLAAIHDAVEIAESVRTLELDAQAPQLIDIGLELRFLGIELRLALRQFLRVEVVGGASAFLRDSREPLLQILHDAVLADDVAEDHADQRQRLVRLLDGEIPATSSPRSAWLGPLVLSWEKR